MSSVYVKLGPGGAVTWKSSVTAAASLPTAGNKDGDVRAAIDTNTLYIWSAGAWHSTGGGGGGGTPVGPSGSLQFNSGGAFNGDSNLTWDNTGKILNIGGLAIHGPSSTISLVNNQPSPVTAFSIDGSLYRFSVIEYSIVRDTSFQIGSLYIVSDGGTGVSIYDGAVPLATSADLGIEFSAVMSGSNVNIQYTSTNTGFNGFMRYSIRQWN